jgi:hypothetical protein
MKAAYKYHVSQFLALPAGHRCPTLIGVGTRSLGPCGVWWPWLMFQAEKCQMILVLTQRSTFFGRLLASKPVIKFVKYLVT